MEATKERQHVHYWLVGKPDEKGYSEARCRDCNKLTVFPATMGSTLIYMEDHCTKHFMNLVMTYHSRALE